MGTTNANLSEQIGHLSDKLDKLIIQYHEDMHGDSSLENGEKGVIGNLRELKKEWCDNPSFLKVMKDNPVKALGAIVVGVPTIFGILHAFYSIPQVNSWLMSLFKIPIP